MKIATPGTVPAPTEEVPVGPCRHAAQRELPRVLIDGSTGRDFNARVERVVFGEWGCLGCTRRGAPAVHDDPDGCGNIADPRAPSLSFLAAFPGILATGELVKEALGIEATLRGEFQHIFYAGPNPDLRSEPARRADCVVGCSNTGWLDAYRKKYADSQASGCSLEIPNAR